MAERMPALFIGHGNPMNALLVNSYTQRWAAIGATLPKPKAILSVSAHWYIEDAAVTVSTAPRTIHDFGGFPRELYQVQYPAPGDSDLAARVQSRVAQHGVEKQPLVAVCGRFAKCSIVAGTAWRPWKGPRSVPGLGAIRN
jgi:4,5-DOPA dioxygenase extradiol